MPALECSGGSNIHRDAPFNLTPQFSFTHIINLVQHLLIPTDPIVVSQNQAARVFICVKNSYTCSSCMQSSQLCIQLDNGVQIQEGILFCICKIGRITSPNFLRTLWPDNNLYKNLRDLRMKLQTTHLCRTQKALDTLEPCRALVWCYGQNTNHSHLSTQYSILTIISQTKSKESSCSKTQLLAYSWAAVVCLHS